jgi:hypothetical protein
MFDDKDNIGQDLLMKSILEAGQEEVPARVWDGISEGLDMVDRRRRIAAWWRKASMTAAVAAAVVAGVFLHRNDEDMIITGGTGSDMIAVVKDTPASTPVPVPEPADAPADKQEIEMSVARKAEIIAEKQITAYHAVPAPEPVVEHIAESGTTDSEPSPYQKTAPTQEEYFPVDWDEEEPIVNKRRIALTFSGITGSNNPNDKAKAGAIRQPSLTKAPTRTGIAESSERNTFGIPVSFGVGVKISLDDKWSIGTGIDYTLLSRKFYGTYIKVNKNGEIGQSVYSDIRNNQHYVGIPVNVFYNILDNSHLNFYAYAGGALEKCFSDSYQLLNTSIVHNEKVKGLQASVNAGLGVEFLAGRHLGFYVDPRIRYYFNNRQPKSIRTEQSLMAGVEMGLRIRL